MPTKTAIKNQNQSSFVFSAAFGFSGEASAGLQTPLTALLREGETLPDLEFLQILIGRWLEADLERLVDADDAHARELASTAAVRQARDDTAKILYAKLLACRRAIEGVFGPGKSARIAGLGAGLPTEPVPLQRFARAAVNILQSPGFSFPDPAVAGATLDSAQLVGEIEPDLVELESILSQLNPERRESTRTQRVKTESLERHEKLVGSSSRLLEAFYELAGLRFYKQRLRNSTRIQRQVTELPDETPAETPSDEAGDEADEVEASPFEADVEPRPVDG